MSLRNYRYWFNKAYKMAAVLRRPRRTHNKENNRLNYEQQTKLGLTIMGSITYNRATSSLFCGYTYCIGNPLLRAMHIVFMDVDVS